MPAPVVMAAVGAGAAAAHGAVLFVPPVAATVVYARFRSKQEAAVVPSSEGAGQQFSPPKTRAGKGVHFAADGESGRISATDRSGLLLTPCGSFAAALTRCLCSDDGRRTSTRTSRGSGRITELMDSLEYQKCIDDEENHDVVDLAGRPVAQATEARRPRSDLFRSVLGRDAAHIRVIGSGTVRTLS